MPDPAITVTLLGTGSPALSPERFSQSTLVEAGGQKLLIDCGRGVVTRLFQAGVALGEVGPLFLTHLHSDHTVGIPDLWITGWFLRRQLRPGAFRVFGPEGTNAMMQHLDAAFAADHHVRTRYEGAPDGIRHEATDIDEGRVYEQDGVTVDAIRVEHWKHDGAPPSLGYRVHFGGYSVVFSGDTAYSPHLIDAARGADVFVHEVQLTDLSDVEETSIRRAPNAEDRTELIMALHTSPREVGRAFTSAQPRLGVYSHIVGPPPASAVEARLIAQTRETYEGPLAVGHDLMRIRIGEMIEVDRADG